MNATPRISVLCVAGSPRRNGNSDRLLAAAIGGIESAGGTPVKLIPSKLAPQACRGCNSCSKTGVCVIDDSMTEVYALVDRVDAILVASPVYFATVPSSLKVLYDRMQPLWAQRFVLKTRPTPSVKRAGAMIVVGGGGDPFGVDCAVTTTKSVFAVLSVEMTEALGIVGPDAPRDIVERPDDLAAARALGVRLVEAASARRVAG